MAGSKRKSMRPGSVKQDETDAPNNCESSNSYCVGGGEVNTGSSLRRALDLTATVTPATTACDLPDPYGESCLDNDCGAGNDDDSLIQLAKHTFRKLTSKAGTNNMWSPTPIQLQSWSILKSTTRGNNPTKHNLIGIATTGSGKTLSYAVPMIDSCARMEEKPRLSPRGVHGLVIVPTRELALQVSKVLKTVSKEANKLSGRRNHKIVALAIYGGVNRDDQIDSLGKTARHIIAATPLRLIDLLGIGIAIGTGKQSVPNESVQKLFEHTRYLVIDEADQMATKSDMSQQIDLIMGFLRNRCSQMVRYSLYSATLSQKAIIKCNEWIDLPRVTIKFNTVTVGKTNSEGVAGEASAGNDKPAEGVGRAGSLDLSTIPSRITQTLHVCSNHKKPKKLMITINKISQQEKERDNKRSRGLLIIFFGRIKTLQYIHGLLQKEEIKGVALHSQMNQQKREAQLNLFRSGKCPILLATDVAGRGIHVKNVKYVINYDFPASLEQYVHRCGRAGRKTVSGRAQNQKEEQASNATVYSFFNRELAPMAKDTVDLLRSCNAWVDPNLIALIPGGTKQGDGESKRKRRKRHKSNSERPDDSDVISPRTQKPKLCNTDGVGDKDEGEDIFPDLSHNRIVLKRASHVAFSDSEEDSLS